MDGDRLFLIDVNNNLLFIDLSKLRDNLAKASEPTVAQISQHPVDDVEELPVNLVFDHVEDFAVAPTHIVLLMSEQPGLIQSINLKSERLNYYIIPDLEKKGKPTAFYSAICFTEKNSLLVAGLSFSKKPATSLILLDNELIPTDHLNIPLEVQPGTEIQKMFVHKLCPFVLKANYCIVGLTDTIIHLVAVLRGKLFIVVPNLKIKPSNLNSNRSFQRLS